MHSEPPGWLYTAYPSISGAGVNISKLMIQVDPSIGASALGITETVLRSISVPAIRSEVIESVERTRMEFEEAFAMISSDDPSYAKVEEWNDQAVRVTEYANTQRKRRVSLKKQREWAEQAKQAVAAARRARQRNSSLYAILEEEWCSGNHEVSDHELVKSRLRRLRGREYILGNGRDIVAGPLLRAWRRLSTNSEKEG
jgi:hypothetical protein